VDDVLRRVSHEERSWGGGYTHLLVAIDKFSKWIEA